MTPMPDQAERSGRAEPAADRLFLSRNEVETLSAKAARGAGMSWGLAEEAGIAVGWLQCRGADGLAALLAHLGRVDGRPWEALAPVIATDGWYPPGAEPLCPVALGATLCDYRDLPEARLGADGLALGPVGYPVLLLPFVADLARHWAVPLSLTWDSGFVEIDGEGQPIGSVDPLARQTHALLRLRIADLPAGHAATPSSCASTRQTMAALNSFAMHTLVPASARSRADAGADSSDND